MPFHLHLYLSLTAMEGRWCTTDDLTISFLHFSLFFAALWDLANSRPVHFLVLSSYVFFSLPCLLPPFRYALQDGFGQTWWTGDMSIPQLTPVQEITDRLTVFMTHETLCWKLRSIGEEKKLRLNQPRKQISFKKATFLVVDMCKPVFWPLGLRWSVTMLSRHSVWTYQGNELTRNSLGYLVHNRLSSLWIDSGLKWN